MRPREFPLLRRELVGLLRTRRAFWLLVSAVGVSSLSLLLSWPSFWDSAPQDPRLNAARFIGFIVTQLIVCLLFTPAFAATAFTVEREERTFELVYSTLLSPLSIVFSKFLSSVGYLLLVLAASAPAVSALYLLGGFGFDTFLTCYAITVAALVSSCLVCLTVSLRSASTAQAMVRSFVWLLIWNGGLGLVLWLVFAVADQAGARIADEAIGTVLLGLSPFSALATAGTPFLDERWPAYFGYAGLLSVGHLIYLLRKTRNPYAVFQTRERKGAGGARPRRPRARSRARRTVLSRLLVSLGDRDVPPFTNPVFQKEIRSEFFSRTRYRRLVFWSSLLLYSLLAIAFKDAWGTAWLHAVATLNLFLVLALVPAVAATSVTREREKGHLDFLRSSLLSQGAILRGKLFSSIYSNCGLVAGMAWVSMISTVCFAATRTTSSGRSATLGIVLLVVLMTLLVLAFAAALSLLASVRARRSIGALLVSYGAVLFICIGVPVLFSLVDISGLDRPLGMAAEPFLAINAAIEGFSRTTGSASGEVYGTLVWFTLIYGLGTVAVFRLAVRSANARLARDR